jgi:hypothetical protein
MKMTNNATALAITVILCILITGCTKTIAEDNVDEITDKVSDAYVSSDTVNLSEMQVGSNESTYTITEDNVDEITEKVSEKYLKSYTLELPELLVGSDEFTYLFGKSFSEKDAYNVFLTDGLFSDYDEFINDEDDEYRELCFKYLTVEDRPIVELTAAASKDGSGVIIAVNDKNYAYVYVYSWDNESAEAFLDNLYNEDYAVYEDSSVFIMTKAILDDLGVTNASLKCFTNVDYMVSYIDYSINEQIIKDGEFLYTKEELLKKCPPVENAYDISIFNPENGYVKFDEEYAQKLLEEEMFTKKNSAANQVYMNASAYITKMIIAGVSDGFFENGKLYGARLSPSLSVINDDFTNGVTYEQFIGSLSCYIYGGDSDEGSDCYIVLRTDGTMLTEAYYGDSKDDIYYGSYPNSRSEATGETLEDLGDITWLN